MNVGQQGPCWWVVMRDAVPPEDHARLVATAREVGRSTRPVCVLLVLHQVPRPSSEERRELADAVASFEHPENVVAMALVTDSAMVRGALTAINWLVKTTVEQRVFATPGPALHWLETLGIGVDALAVEAAIAQADPAFPLLRWW